MDIILTLLGDDTLVKVVKWGLVAAALVGVVAALARRKRVGGAASGLAALGFLALTLSFGFDAMLHSDRFTFGDKSTAEVLALIFFVLEPLGVVLLAVAFAAARSAGGSEVPSYGPPAGGFGQPAPQPWQQQGQQNWPR